MSSTATSIVRFTAILIISISMLFAGAEMAEAQRFVPLAETPSGSKLGDLYSSDSLPNFINKLFTAAIAVGAIIAVLRIAFAGYLYMATDAWHTKGKAKEIIGDVIIGILLLLSIWLILRQINPDLLNLDVLRNLQKK